MGACFWIEKIAWSGIFITLVIWLLYIAYLVFDSKCIKCVSCNRIRKRKRSSLRKVSTIDEGVCEKCLLAQEYDALRAIELHKQYRSMY